MKITEITFTPKAEQREALVYSEHASRGRSLHLFFQHESNEQRRFLLAAFKETVRDFLSPTDLKPPLRFIASLIERYESLQEDLDLTVEDLNGMGLFLLLQVAGRVYLVTSLENQVQVRTGGRVPRALPGYPVQFERLDAFDTPTQEELFPRRLRDTLSILRIAPPAEGSLDVVLACREEELGGVLSAVQDATCGRTGETVEVPLDVLSKRVLVVRFEEFDASRRPAEERDAGKISLKAPFGLIHIGAIVATAAVVFIAGAVWIGGRSSEPSSGSASGTFPSQSREASLLAQPEPGSGGAEEQRELAAAEPLVDLASVSLRLVWSKKYGKAVTSSPVVSGTAVIFGCRDGRMRALDTRTGDELWSYQASGGIGASPALAGSAIICADYTGAVFALDVNTGNLLWESKLPGKVVSSPCVLGQRVAIGCFDNFVYCLSVPDGRVLWNAEVHGTVWGSAAGRDEFFYVPSYDGMLYALSAGTGKTVWTYNLGEKIMSSPAAAGDHVIIGAPDGRLHAVDRTSGRAAWIFQAGAPINSFIYAASGDGRVFFGSSDANLYCTEGADGSLIWKCKTKGEVLGKACPADGMIFVGSYDKTLYCVNMETGAVIDRFETSGKIYSSPAVDGERVFFGNNEGTFYCLRYFNERTS